MKRMWAEENKRALWALLGEAYSDLRDHHAELIPLEKFLSLAVPLLPIIPAGLYLAKMGWMLVTNWAGQTELSRNPNFNADLLAAEYPARTNMSSKDIVDHCYSKGLAVRAHRQRKPSLREALFREGLMNTPTASTQAPPPNCGALTLAVTPQSVCLS